MAFLISEPSMEAWLPNHLSMTIQSGHPGRHSSGNITSTTVVDVSCLFSITCLLANVKQFVPGRYHIKPSYTRRSMANLNQLLLGRSHIEHCSRTTRINPGPEAIDTAQLGSKKCWWLVNFVGYPHSWPSSWIYSWIAGWIAGGTFIAIGDLVASNCR